MTWRTFRRYFLIGNLLGIFACFGCVFSVYLFRQYGMAQRAEVLKLDDSEQYLVGYAHLLGDNWETGSPYKDEPDDMAGMSSSVAGHHILYTSHQSAELINIRHHAITYKNIETAHERYLVQYDWIFARDFGVPPSRQLFSYYPLPVAMHLNADEYHAACVTALWNTICRGLFRYDNHIIYLQAFIARNGTVYLPRKTLAKLIIYMDIVITKKDWQVKIQ